MVSRRAITYSNARRNKNSRPGASVRRRRLLSANPFAPVGCLVLNFGRVKRSFATQSLVRADRGRVADQEVAWAAQRVVRVGGLCHRWPRVEVVVVIARGAAATEWAAAWGRTRAEVVSSATCAMNVRAALSVREERGAIIDVALWMAVAVATPGGRTAGRAIVLGIGVSAARGLAAVAIEDAAVAAGAVGFEISATAASPFATFATADGSRRVASHLQMARFAVVAARASACGSARIAAGWAARLSTVRFRTDRPAPGGCKHREREHKKCAFHLSPLVTEKSSRGAKKRASGASAVWSIHLVSAAQSAEFSKRRCRALNGRLPFVEPEPNSAEREDSSRRWLGVQQGHGLISAR